MNATIPLWVLGGASDSDVEKAIEEQQLIEAGEAMLRKAEADKLSRVTVYGDRRPAALMFEI